MSFVVNTTSRSIVPGSSKVTIINGDGLAGDPTIDIVPANIDLATLTGVLPVANGGTGSSTGGSALSTYLDTTFTIANSASIQSIPVEFDVDANQVVAFDISLWCQGDTNSTPIRLGLDVPPGTTYTGLMLGAPRANTQVQYAEYTTPGAVAQVPFGNTNGGSGFFPVRMAGTLFSGSTAGTVTVLFQFAFATRSNWQVLAGSSVQVTQLTPL